MNPRPIIEKYCTLSVRDTFRALRTPASVLKIIAEVAADCLTGIPGDTESWDTLMDLLDHGREIGLTDTEMTSAIARAGR